MKFRNTIIALTLFMAACATVPSTPEQLLYATCRGIADTEMALRPYKPVMTLESRELILEIVTDANIVCASEGNAETALETVRAALRELVRQQALMEAANAN